MMSDSVTISLASSTRLDSDVSMKAFLLSSRSPELGVAFLRPLHRLMFSFCDVGEKWVSSCVKCVELNGADTMHTHNYSIKK